MGRLLHVLRLGRPVVVVVGLVMFVVVVVVMVMLAVVVRLGQAGGARRDTRSPAFLSNRIA